MKEFQQFEKYLYEYNHFMILCNRRISLYSILDEFKCHVEYNHHCFYFKKNFENISLFHNCLPDKMVCRRSDYKINCPIHFGNIIEHWWIEDGFILGCYFRNGIINNFGWKLSYGDFTMCINLIKKTILNIRSDTISSFLLTNQEKILNRYLTFLKSEYKDEYFFIMNHLEKSLDKKNFVLINLFESIIRNGFLI